MRFLPLLLLIAVGPPGCNSSKSDALADALRDRDYAAIAAQLGSADTSEHCRAAKALAWARGDAVVTHQLSLLQDRRCDWTIPVEAAWRLVEHRHVAAVPAIAEMLSDPDEKIRWNAARLLGEMGDASGKAAVDACAKDDKDDIVRQWCTWSKCTLTAISSEQRPSCEKPEMALYKLDAPDTAPK